MSLSEGKITEETSFSIPLTGEFETKIRTDLKYKEITNFILFFNIFVGPDQN